MRTFGIDLASQPALTAGCLIDWRDRPLVIDVIRPLTDDAIVRLARDPLVSVTAIDAPFGWPRVFVDAVHRYDQGEPFSEEPGDLWLRRTDRHVLKTTRRRPLSVSGDRIAYPAVRAARLLTRLGPGRPARRDGSDRVIEVYPAAAMMKWGVVPGRYKPRDAVEVRRTLADTLVAALPGLDLGAHRETLAATDHAIDALIAAFVARAFALGQAGRFDEKEVGSAAAEGWIWLPDHPIAALLDGR
jgi:predicted nuclease with RNAse H fold